MTLYTENCRHSLNDSTLDKYQICYDTNTDSYKNNIIHIKDSYPDYANQQMYIYKSVFNTKIKYIYAGTTDYIGEAHPKQIILNSLIYPPGYFPFNLLYLTTPINVLTITQVTTPILDIQNNDIIRAIGYEIPLSECSNKVTNGNIMCNSYVHNDGLYFLRDEMIVSTLDKITLDNSGDFSYDHIISRAGVNHFYLADINNNIVKDLGTEIIKPVFNSINILNPIYNQSIGISGKINFVNMSTPTIYNGYIANDTSGHILTLKISDNMDFLFPEKFCINGINRIRIGLLDILQRELFFETIFYVDINLPCKISICDFTLV